MHIGSCPVSLLFRTRETLDNTVQYNIESDGQPASKTRDPDSCVFVGLERETMTKSSREDALHQISYLPTIGLTKVKDYLTETQLSDDQALSSDSS